jgi:hypothetical protein
MPRTLPAGATIRVAEDILASAFEEELVLLNLRDGVYYGLQGVASRIWSLIQRPTTIAEIRDALVAEYDVEPRRCEADLRGLLTELVGRGLAVVVPR